MEHYYFDHAATTPVNSEVLEIMINSLKEDFGNADSLHFFGQKEKSKLQSARKFIAQYIGAKTQEVFFTSGATESNNTIIKQTAYARSKFGKHLITTSIEHPSVLNVMKELVKEGFEVTFLPVDENGEIKVEQIAKALRPDTILVSIMAGNNETGSLLPIKEIGELVEPTNAWFHVDGTQEIGEIPINVQDIKADFLSASAHKIYGPKGIGLLYKRDSIMIPPLLLGGEQESKFRAGTTNMPAILGFKKALELLPTEKIIKNAEIYRSYKNKIIRILTDAKVDFAVNGSLDNSLPQILNIWLNGIPARTILPLLDLDGFAISAGSACTAGSLEPSHVLQAMYKNSPRINESIRISFGSDNDLNSVSLLAHDIIKHVRTIKNRG